MNTSQDNSVEPQPTDPVARWLFDAVKTNLDQLHALCLEFGCEQGDTVVDWLRKRLDVSCDYAEQLAALVDIWADAGKPHEERSYVEGALAIQFMEATKITAGHPPRAAAPTGYCIRHADGARWRTLDSMGMPDWTADEAEALCFSLRHHADAFACDDPEDVRIVPR